MTDWTCGFSSSYYSLGFRLQSTVLSFNIREIGQRFGLGQEFRSRVVNFVPIQETSFLGCVSLTYVIVKGVWKGSDYLVIIIYTPFPFTNINK